MFKNGVTKYYLFALSLIALDQIIKLLVYYYMQPGLLGEIKIFGNWFKLHYTLNPGMAFGLTLGPVYGKIILSIFRMIAVSAIAYYIYTIHKTAHKTYLWCMAAILGGAIGNVMDSTFYGVLLQNAPYDSITPWFHGQVIDMFYLDIWEGYLPDYLPLWGGEYTALWPIFNFADASIFVGVLIILIFQKKFLVETGPTEKAPANEN